jgi:methyltransferase-like protein/SAM-dependent methyltransferase
MSENQPTNERFSYDVLAYPSFIFPQTHPDRLSAIAKILGMNPAPAEKCRVLELGCGTGTNLNWLAHNLPESEFIGIDLAQIHISEAEKNKAELELQNVSFFSKDVLEISQETFGKFDYIIAHGLFSWVPDFVREKTLQLYDELLNPNGVGFISYNVYPGFHRRQIVRDIMRFYTQKIENPLEKVREGVDFIEFLSSHADGLTEQMFKHELEDFARRRAENIYHDDFAEINQPFYFTEFIAEAEKHNLQFLSECDYFPHQPNNLPDEAAKRFSEISRNTIEYEQYSDFVKCRQFRQTLLCKKDINLDRESDPLKIKNFYISSLFKADSPNIDLAPNSVKQFINDKNTRIDVSHNLTKVVLALLSNSGWHLLKFEDLIKQSREFLEFLGVIFKDLENEVKITAYTLFQLYSPYKIEFHTAKSNALNFVSEKPLADKFARWHSTRENFAVNFYGFKLDTQNNFLSLLLPMLDGTRTREDLLAELTEIIRADGEEAILAELPEKLDENLFELAKTGFLVG